MPKPNPYRQLAYAPDLTGPAHALPWADQALCAQADPDLWFEQSSSRYETHNGREAEERRSMAKAICERCPVRPECLEHAMADSTLQGIWGGLTEKERRELRRARRTA